MKLKVASGNILEYKCDVLAVNLFEGLKKPGGATGAVDKALGGAISKLIKSGEFKGKKSGALLLALKRLRKRLPLRLCQKKRQSKCQKKPR